MILQSGTFYWPTTLPNRPEYSPLEEDITCDVLIIGGGISGAQCAYILCHTGLKIVVVEKHKIGSGSTASNTALIQYLGDKMLHELVNSFGEEQAIRHTILCRQAINEIEYASRHLSFDPNFIRRDTLYFASYEEDVQKLQNELFYLQKHSFAVRLLTEKEISKLYPFQKKAALYLYNDAEINPYIYTIGLLDMAKQKGSNIYENTEIIGKVFKQDGVIFYTKHRHRIAAKHVIIAAGYEGLLFKKEKNAVISSTYSVVTNSVADLSDWYNRTLIWETARPYLYMRTTHDNRIIIGGLDEQTSDPQERDAKLIHKKKALIQEFNKLFPNIHVQPEFTVAAHFGGTHDGLPILGIYDTKPNCYFLFGYGDNGTVYSMVLASLIRDIITKGSHPNIDLYLQTRPMIHIR
ncbi:NAD(P)/FAD-dependent oxidoreductase [Ectobacillus polymachus]|uniref:NAD(P)/FAD-dependent oxidoreductase n=1 Tax=Ectobacillus polymachus TaxID=1508806 RepID=UPI003A87BA0D